MLMLKKKKNTGKVDLRKYSLISMIAESGDIHEIINLVFVGKK